MRWIVPRFSLKAALSPEKQPTFTAFFVEISAIVVFILISSLTATPWPDDQDGVNFVLGIIRYDPLVHQPHFPGYPVYIFLCKVSTFLSGTPERGAVNLSIFSGAASLYLMMSLLRTSYSNLTAILCGFLLAANPVFFEFSHKIFSELAALALLLFSVTILKDPRTSSRRRWFTSLLMLGLLLGVRLSWWPFPLVYFLAGIYYKRTNYALAGTIVGVLIWLIPQTTLIGLTAFLQSGASFTHGHFTKWGGAIGSLFEQDYRIILVSHRVKEAWGLLSDSSAWLSLPWFLLSMLGLLISLHRARNIILKKYRVVERKRRNEKKFSGGVSTPPPENFSLFFLALSTYLAWVFLGQNPEKVRHFLPLLPAFIIVAAPAVEIFQKGAFIAFVGLAISLSVNYSSKDGNLPPNKRFRDWVNEAGLPDANFFCGPSERYFDLYPVKNRVVSVQSMKELNFEIDAAWPKSRSNFVCDDIPGFKEDKGVFRYFLNRKGDPVDRALKIYELR